MRLLLPGLLLACGLSWAQAQGVTGVEVTGAGLMELREVQTHDDAQISTGHRYGATSATVVERTTVIKLKKGIVIGLTAIIRGSPKGQRIPLRVVWRYPQPGMRNPDTGVAKLDDQFETREKLGDETFFYWQLGAEWALVPGEWTFELWDGNRMLAQQSFTLVK